MGCNSFRKSETRNRCTCHTKMTLNSQQYTRNMGFGYGRNSLFANSGRAPANETILFVQNITRRYRYGGNAICSHNEILLYTRNKTKNRTIIT